MVKSGSKIYMCQVSPFFFFSLELFQSSVLCIFGWRWGEGMGERGRKCAFWHVGLSHWTALQDSAVFGCSFPPPFLLPIFKKNKYAQELKYKAHHWLFFLFLKSQYAVFHWGEEEELNGSFSNPFDNARAHFDVWFMPVTNRLPGSWWLK